MQKSTIEGALVVRLSIYNLIIVLLIGFSLHAYSVGLVLGSFVIMVVLIALGYAGNAHYKSVVSPYSAVLQHLDALFNEDYLLRASKSYEQGIVADIHSRLFNLSEAMQAKKGIYDKSIYLMYSLIEQLDTPILILNQRSQLIRANPAFSKFYGQPWYLLKKYTATRLGLVKSEKNWAFTDIEKNSNWEIRQSDFRSDDDIYELLVLIDLQTTIRKTQQESWQKIIRVLSHEINNSLTPIQSLAQSISENEQISEPGKKVLNIIYERSVSLQKFINRYDECSKPQAPNFQLLSSMALFEHIAPLFKQQQLILCGDPVIIWADPILMEQVLINLIKNAFEASDADSPVSLSFSQSNDEFVIKITDNGHSIQNLENIMTPFYTTKPNGQGLGLDLCRNLVESQNGQIRLQNRQNTKGAEAIITMPRPL